MSMTREDDGSFVLLQRNTKLEAEMNHTHVRWPGEMRWSPKRTGVDYRNYNRLYYKTQSCAAIVGKGPSLDRITKESFGKNDIVICCNDSVHRIGSLCLKLPLYSVQLDEGLRDTCRSNHAHHFISPWAKDWIPEATVIPLEAPKRGEKLLTALEAIRLAKHMGCGFFKLIGFDAMFGEVGYANCIGYGAGKNPKRFLAHKDSILQELEDTLWWAVGPDGKKVTTKNGEWIECS